MKIKFYSFIGVVMLCMATISCSKKTEPVVVRPVETIVVPKAGLSQVKNFSGLSKADDELDLSFRISGNIEAIPVSTGDKIKAGTLIARLESTDQELEVSKAQAKIAERLAKLKQAKSELERALLLYEADNISKSELDSQEATYLSVKAQLDANKKNLSLAKQKLSYCWLYAPNDGVIAEIPPSNHQVVSPGELVAVLQVTGPLEIEFGVAESLINAFRLGQRSLAKFDFIKDKKFNAKVTQIGVSPDESTTYPVKVSLLDADKRIRPGMVCDLEFKFNKAIGEQFITLPPSSVVGDVSGKNYVWLFDKDSSKVKKQFVKVGKFNNSGVQILGGLQGGETVITRGANTVEEGMKVKLL